MKLDSRDSKILNELRKNSRSTVREIAKRTGTRPSTVHQRIARLKEDGIIEKFTIKTSNAKLGENFIVFMSISTSRDIEEQFFQSPHIKEVFGITGEYDLLLKLKFRDIEEFNNFIISVRQNKAITKTITSIATIAIKEEI